jgi:hypothetical protein
MTRSPIVLLVEADNTLLTNDRIQNDLKRHLEHDVVFQRRKIERSDIFEAVERPRRAIHGSD